MFAGQVVFPKPEDTAYYVGVARNLVEGRGLVSDALWSYATPPLVFPRPAFEVWLPLPTFLAAIPMLLLGPTLAAAQVIERARRGDRARPRAGGSRPMSPRSGACPRSAPGRWHSGPASPRPSTCRSSFTRRSRTPRCSFAALALGACLLMARVLRAPTPGPSGRRASARDRRPPGAGRVDPQRGGVARAHLGRPRRGGTGCRSGDEGADHRRGRGSSRRWSSSRHGRYRNWSAFGSPLPGQAVTNAFSVTGFDIFAWNDPPDLGSPPGGRAGAAHRDACRGPRPQPVQRPGAARFSPVGDRPPCAAMDGTRPSRQAGPRGQRHHLPRDEPGVPRGDDLGHVPACRRTRTGAHRPVRLARARRTAGRGRTTARLDEGCQLARRDDGCRLERAVLGRAAGRFRHRVARDRASVRRAGDAHVRRRPLRSPHRESAS